MLTISQTVCHEELPIIENTRIDEDIRRRLVLRQTAGGGFWDDSENEIEIENEVHTNEMAVTRTVKRKIRKRSNVHHAIDLYAEARKIERDKIEKQLKWDARKSSKK